MPSPSPADRQPRYLDITDKSGHVQRFLLTEGPLILGRGEDAGLRLESKGASRHHAEMSVDELGRWSIRDMNSRNGTHVNGVKLEASSEEKHWQLLEPGDEISIGPFQLTLMVDTPALDWAMDHQLSFVNEQDDEQAGHNISQLRGDETVHITPDQLEAIGALGKRLVQIADTRRRLLALCQRLLSEKLRGLAVVALRLNKEAPADAARGLIEPMYSTQWPKGEPIYISRSTLRGVLAAGRGVVATMGGEGGAGGVKMSITPDQHPAGSMAVIACPLAQNDKVMDVLYLVVPADCGTPDWLAVVTLAAQQFDLVREARGLYQR